jgi:hypothetical protein
VREADRQQGDLVRQKLLGDDTVERPAEAQLA